MKNQNVVMKNGKVLPQTSEQLFDAIGFDLYNYMFKNDEFKAVTSEVFETVKPKLKMQKSGSTKYRKYNDCVRHIIYNAYMGDIVNLPVKHNLKKTIFGASEWFGINQFTYRIFIRALDALVEVGYLDRIKGYSNRTKLQYKKGMVSRFQATGKLKSLFTKILDKDVAERLPRKNNIVLRDSEKVDIDLSDLVDGKYDVNIDEFNKTSENLKLYNEFASRQIILLPLTDVKVTHDFLIKLRLQMARGMIDIYHLDEENEFAFNFNESINYIKNLYINNNITNNTSTNTITKYHNSINALLGTFFQKKCNFIIPYNKRKSRKSFTIKNWLIHIKQNHLHSVFNNSSFKYGGRKYGSVVQELPNRSHRVKITPLRKLLLINFNKVIEIDYKSLHPRLLYNKYLGEPCPDDVYGGFRNKDMVKSSLLVMLNCLDEHPDRRDTIKAIRKKLIDDGFYSEDGLKNEDINKILDFVEEKHPLIAPWIGSGIAPELMRIDSAIMEDILMNLYHQNIFSIPMHDSVIVEECFRQQLENEMKECYVKHIGWEPIYELK